jgi:triosephosphate isomerase
MRKPIIAGNWKMHKNPDEAFELMDSMLEDLDVIEGVDIVICPAFTSIEVFAELFKGTSLYLGAQNMHWGVAGPFTGEISPHMLAGRCEYVILGHSERRQHFHETDEDVRKKVEAAIQHNLKPIICVGENLQQREEGHTVEIIHRQVSAALHGLPLEGALTCTIAYEPIWAIGTGQPATAEGANHVAQQIRDHVRVLNGKTVAEELRIQYGGSVTPANIVEFMRQPNIDGALVGGASLSRDAFVGIVSKAAEAYR